MAELAPVDTLEQTHDERVRSTELLISNLLRGGVLLSIALVLAGTLLSFIAHPDYLTSSQNMTALEQGKVSFPTTLRGVVSGLRSSDGPALVMSGLLVLIATPILRVAVSVLAFVQLRDRTFTLITMGVLSLLLTALFLGKAGG